jgi:bifunctional UDP-N-acetylglucosamine pyrophosphorylase/glucosamine-1-phosphate N-acetyltransferase
MPESITAKTICFEDFSELLSRSIITQVAAEYAAGSNRVYCELCEAVRAHTIDVLIERGVIIPCSDGVIISPLAEIGEGTTIYPGTQIRSKVTIGAGCVIGPNSVIEESTIGNNCVINSTQVYSSVIEDDVKIGPFCHVRPNCRIKSGAKIGDFVEIKNSTVGEGTHASHLTYIGDSDVGARVNFGCGVVTVNYDGSKKARTTIDDDAFIGCNTNLIAPVKIGKGAYTAAGSTITDDVPDGALAIARERQVNKLNWKRKGDK